MQPRFEQARLAGPQSGLEVRSIEVRDSREMEAAFDATKRNQPRVS
jgi:hypothetical protein